MPALTPIRIASLLAPYYSQVIDNKEIMGRLSDYLDLLVKWNARTNLTAVRDPEEMVTRHFGESLFAASVLQPLLPAAATLLDFGSGAGFPGVPIQLACPTFHVTLGESQNKKATFLREVVRSLALPSEVWAQRVESMAADRQFDCVAMRAVDHMDDAIQAALPRVRSGGVLALLAGNRSPQPDPLQVLRLLATHPTPGSQQTTVTLYEVARGG